MKFLKNPTVFVLHILVIGLIVATAVGGVV